MTVLGEGEHKRTWSPMAVPIGFVVVSAAGWTAIGGMAPSLIPDAFFFVGVALSAGVLAAMALAAGGVIDSRWALLSGALVVGGGFLSLGLDAFSPMAYDVLPATRTDWIEGIGISGLVLTKAVLLLGLGVTLALMAGARQRNEPVLWRKSSRASLAVMLGVTSASIGLWLLISWDIT